MSSNLSLVNCPANKKICDTYPTSTKPPIEVLYSSGVQNVCLVARLVFSLNSISCDSTTGSLSYSYFVQNWPSDTTKIRSVLGGWLYAYELPVSSLLPTVRRSDSPDEILRKEQLRKVDRQRTLSLKHVEESKAKAARVREKLARESEKLAREPLRGREGEEERGSEGTSPKRRRLETEDTVEQDAGQRSGVEGVMDGGGVTYVDDEMDFEDSDEVCNLSASGGNAVYLESYVFAVHRRMVSLVCVCFFCVFF